MLVDELNQSKTEVTIKGVRNTEIQSMVQDILEISKQDHFTFHHVSRDCTMFTSSPVIHHLLCLSPHRKTSIDRRRLRSTSTGGDSPE
ncbi:hypothetical protein Bca52824_007463 [Brassica carinata]|uniref:Uncharacterized protein n=1 Tax=Brassica carinata TaxID=52824 RepID=A0A8X7W9C5_BRACI|nr:hypothetical protein Bca52824_007463 [Brassica carinata]